MIRYFLRDIVQPLNYDLHSGLNTLGRNPTNDFRIPEASVSSFHCEIEISDSGVFVRDLQSTNGTFINDQPVDQAQLQPGQVLQLGTVMLRLETENVEIYVPKVVPPVQETEKAPVLPDGRPADRRNPQIPATHRCAKCGSTYHVSNVRGVRLSGAASAILFCPDCDGRCEAIPGAGQAEDSTFLGRLTQTILVAWRKK